MYSRSRIYLRQQKQFLKLLFLIGLLLVQSACTSNMATQDSPTQTASESTMFTEPTNIASAFPTWQTEFNLEDRELSDTGENDFFILVPGYQLVLESDSEHLLIIVTDETREINGITTRVLEERETRNGELYEISRNFYAIDNATGDVFYFGEEVDFYENGEVVRHTGAWLAFEENSVPGIIMPGVPSVGMRYFQEIAPDVAMDRAEIVSLSETFSTLAGEFVDCLVTEESTPLEPKVKERKTYAPGIGLIQDERLLLVSHGYVDE